MKKRSIVLAIVLQSMIFSVDAREARLAHVFQDNMVLQREKAVAVWGWGEPGTPVRVRFADQEKTTGVGNDGRWRLSLAPIDASAEGRPLTVTMGETTVTRRNVVVGEVWIAAGQSNMNHGGPDRPTGLYPHYTSPGTEGGKPAIRSIRFGSGASLEALEDVVSFKRGDEPWNLVNEPFTSTNMANYFARVVRDELDVPVGILHVAVSGTNQAAWMSKETLESFPGKGEHANFYEQLLASSKENLAKGGDIRSWEDFQRAEAEWLENRQGRYPGSGRTFVNFPTALYNTRIHPLAPFTVRGTIWHQGEGGPGGPYGERLVAMAKQWRELFGQDFAFLWGTLTRDTSGQPPLKPQPEWFYRSGTNPSIRHAEELFADDDSTGMVELYDVGDHETHFHQKAEAGRRMGLAALDRVYGRSRVFSGPLMSGVAVEGGKATVTWSRVADGLVYLPSINGISGFYIQGKGADYRWAEVEVVSEDTLVLSHPEVEEITALGYAVNQNPHETLFNSAGFPASPFRWRMSRIPWSGHVQGDLLGFQPDTEEKATYNLGHLRRGGYVFQFMKGRNTPDGQQVAVEAYLSPEWETPVVLVDGRPVEFKTVDREGAAVAWFDAPVDDSWIVVADKDQALALDRFRRY